MADWQRYAWVEEANEATIAVIDGAAATAGELLARLGPTEDVGTLTFDAARELQGGLYDDGTAEERAVFQIGRLPGIDGECWVTVEPNGYRASLRDTFLRLAAGEHAASFFWNVNAVMCVLRVRAGEVLVDFDPLLDVEHVPDEGGDLPFGRPHPRAAALALIERWTGVAITENWFAAPKPTFVVEVASSSPAPYDGISAAGLRRAAALLWPDWVEVEGCVLRREAADVENVRKWLAGDGGSVQRTEWALNHVHLWDEIEQGPDDPLHDVAERVAAAWRASLAAAFPARTFLVELGPEADYGPTIYAHSVTDEAAPS